MKSDDLLFNTNSTNSAYISNTWVKPKFNDTGDLHLYTLNWHPNYIEILVDGKRKEF